MTASRSMPAARVWRLGSRPAGGRRARRSDAALADRTGAHHCVHRAADITPGVRRRPPDPGADVAADVDEELVRSAPARTRSGSPPRPTPPAPYVRQAPVLEVPARYGHQLPQDVPGHAVGVLIGHDADVVGQEQRAGFTDQPRQLGAVGVDLRAAQARVRRRRPAGGSRRLRRPRRRRHDDRCQRSCERAQPGGRQRALSPIL